MPSLAQRLARLRPYLRPGRRGLIGAGLGALVGAATEPAIPALLKPLLDEGFGADRSWPLWWVPVLIVGLFTLRGLAGFVAQYGLAWAAQRAVLALRQDLFAHLLASPSGLFTRQSASQLTNTVVYEVQQGATLLINALLTLAKDSLTLVALLVYLLWLNWQLTLLVGLLFPALAVVMRHLGRRLRRLTVAGQQATDELAYVVEENVLAWRIVRLHGAEPAQASRFGAQGEHLRRLMMKAGLGVTISFQISVVGSDFSNSSRRRRRAASSSRCFTSCSSSQTCWRKWSRILASWSSLRSSGAIRSKLTISAGTDVAPIAGSCSADVTDRRNRPN